MRIFDFLKEIFLLNNKNETPNEEIAVESPNIDVNSELSIEERERNFYFQKFEDFDKIRIAQDNLELNGEGTCIMISGSDRYGHVKFRFYASAKSNSEIVCSVSEKELPKYCRDSVDKVANLFIDFIEKERADGQKFIFEIIDSTYHPVDARAMAYEVATFRAIQNSFDESLHKPNLRLVRREIKQEKIVKIKRKSNFKL
ncbi:MAG: hypothetical protein REI96_21190 [Flavobacterium nitrogenifigens]|uniref:Uncharacterized protein n=1 Tax=Flavobacterium nitrogenifigens TaxID=1617283 RepID=A0A521BJT1_9FLAO|nr:hypothetical protein [Flavobacterium nitrogenifigens]KAF2330918.1 hypothetical protein DM397_14105 [Flavobacterium nitrogenifigens]MDQ8014974.1 hypothetical protein [Flavobacterium nitrogenifigens]SMO47349.1 hypothetical protein SAMN06265220_1011062 [Flavobacterium nitrogenifigens]